MRKRELVAARAKLGVSQATLAKLIGKHRGTVACYEIGTLAIPRTVELAVKYLLLTHHEKVS